MRRKTPQHVEPPADLRAFDPGNLTGEPMWAAYRAWCNDRIDHGNTHGWPGGMVVLIQQNRAVRRKMCGFVQT